MAWVWPPVRLVQERERELQTFPEEHLDEMTGFSIATKDLTRRESATNGHPVLSVSSEEVWRSHGPLESAFVRNRRPATHGRRRSLASSGSLALQLSLWGATKQVSSLSSTVFADEQCVKRVQKWLLHQPIGALALACAGC